MTEQYNKKLPPYGKYIGPGVGEVWIYFGANAWIPARSRHQRGMPVLLLPPGENPDDFCWPIADAEVLLLQYGAFDVQRIAYFAAVLFQYKAAVVRAVYGVGRLVVYQENSA